jgi:hypothetical protein
MINIHTQSHPSLRYCAGFANRWTTRRKS